MGWWRCPSSPLRSDQWWLAPAAFHPRQGVGQLQGARAVLPVQKAGARAALNSLGGGLQWNRRLGVEFQEVAGAILYIGGSYVMMRRDSTTKLISNSLLKFTDSVRIRFSSSWG
jgi:hypothetical protein